MSCEKTAVEAFEGPGRINCAGSDRSFWAQYVEPDEGITFEVRPDLIMPVAGKVMGGICLRDAEFWLGSSQS